MGSEKTDNSPMSTTTDENIKKESSIIILSKIAIAGVVCVTLVLVCFTYYRHKIKKEEKSPKKRLSQLKREEKLVNVKLPDANRKESFYDECRSIENASSTGNTVSHCNLPRS